MNIIMKAAEIETRGPKMNSGIYQPARRGIMDNLPVKTGRHYRLVYSALEEFASWGRMIFKPWKSRFMIWLKKTNNSGLQILDISARDVTKTYVAACAERDTNDNCRETGKQELVKRLRVPPRTS